MFEKAKIKAIEMAILSFRISTLDHKSFLR